MPSLQERIYDELSVLRVPEETFEAFLARHNWTYAQVERGQYPGAITCFGQLQLACICSDPYLWTRTFMKEPKNPTQPYGVWDYQAESLRWLGDFIHYDAAEVGKTREIVAKILYLAFNTKYGSGLLGAPLQAHLDEVIDAIFAQLDNNPILGECIQSYRKKPYHKIVFTNGFTLYFRPSGFDGGAYRGVHVTTFAFKDEAAKDKNRLTWTEFFRAMEPGCIFGAYSVPDGDRKSEFYRLGQLAKSQTISMLKAQEASRPSFIDSEQMLASVPPPTDLASPPDIDVRGLDEDDFLSDRILRHFNWRKDMMPEPFWSEGRRRKLISLYGGEDTPEYRHNVYGEDGDPVSTVFPSHYLEKNLADIPDYRCLQVLYDEKEGAASVYGFRMEGREPAALMDERQPLAFFDLPTLIGQFFIRQPEDVLCFMGADFGHSPDPTEILVKAVKGEKHRLIARLQLKGVTYDQQEAAVLAMLRVFDPRQNMRIGMDIGNAGSAVYHYLIARKELHLDERITPVDMGSKHDLIDESGALIPDGKGNPIRRRAKTIGTSFLVRRMFRQQLEYPFDPEIVTSYPGYTGHAGSDGDTIYSRKDDHIIAADQAGTFGFITSNLDHFDISGITTSGQRLDGVGEGITGPDAGMSLDSAGAFLTPGGDSW